MQVHVYAYVIHECSLRTIDGNWQPLSNPSEDTHLLSLSDIIDSAKNHLLCTIHENNHIHVLQCYYGAINRLKLHTTLTK